MRPILLFLARLDALDLELRRARFGAAQTKEDS